MSHLQSAKLRVREDRLKQDGKCLLLYWERRDRSTMKKREAEKPTRRISSRLISFHLIILLGSLADWRTLHIPRCVCLVQEKDHSRVIKVVQEASELNVRFQNKIVRKMVWSRDGSTLILSGTPTTITETPADDKSQEGDKGSSIKGSSIGRQSSTVDKRKAALSSLQDFVMRRSGDLEIREDETSCVVRIMQVNEVESTIEMLVSKPKQRRKSLMNADKGIIIQNRRANGAEVNERERVTIMKQLPDLYDFRTLSTMQKCFQKWRPLELLDKSDGMVMGKMLMENSSRLHNTHERSKKGRREKLDWFFDEFRSMKSLKGEYPWVETMMEAVLIGDEDTMEAAAGGEKKNFDKMR